MSIVVAMIAASLLSLAGFYLVVAGAVTGHGTTGAVESAVMVVVWLAHLAAVVGLLLRSAWGRFVAAACSAAWLVALLVQIVDHLVYGRPVAAVEGIAVGSIAVALTTLAFRLLFGRSERGYTETHAVSGPKGDA